MKRALVVLLLTCVMFLGIGVVGAGSASAVSLHQHRLATPSGQVDVALGFCKNPQLFGVGARNHFVFEHYHDWIHAGPVPTTVTAAGC